MGRRKFASFDRNKMYAPSGEKQASSGLTLVYVDSGFPLGTIIHSDIAMPVNSKFSVEFSFGAPTRPELAVGFCSKDNTFANKEFKVQGGSTNVTVDGVPIVDTASLINGIVHLDFDGETGRTRVYVNQLLKADVIVASLIGKPVYVYAASSSAFGSLSMNPGVDGNTYVRGAADYHEPFMAIVQNLDYGSTPYSQSPMYDSTYSPYADPQIEMGTYAAGVTGLTANATHMVGETQFRYMPILQGGLNTGARTDGFGLKTHLGRNSKAIRMAPVMRMSQAGNKKTSGFEQNHQSEYRPREFWGDY